MSEEIRPIPLDQIQTNPYQPRSRFGEEGLEELASSIRQHGIIQPVVVRRHEEGYQLIAGERRVRAARRAGLAEVPAVVRAYTDEQALEAALVENLQREDISVVEAARAFQRLAAEFHYSHAEIALRTGKSRTAVTNTLRLLQLPDAVLGMLERGDLTEGHARTLLGLPYASLQVEVAQWVIRNAVSVRELERKVREVGSGQEPEHRPESGVPARDANLTALEELLRDHFGTKVALSYRGGRGTLLLEFYGEDDLARLLELMRVEG